MNHRITPYVPSTLDPKVLADSIDKAIGPLTKLFDALELLRGLDDADAAVRALLDVRPVKKFRLSFELWETLAAGQGADALELVEPHLGKDVLDWIVCALWGARRSGRPALTIVR